MPWRSSGWLRTRPGAIRMQSLVSRAHRHERGDAFRPGLGALGCRHSVENRVSVRGIECFEEGASPVVAAEGFCEIAWDGRGLRGLVRALPSAIALRAINFSESRRFHAPAFDEGFGLGTIDLGPRTSGCSRCESLQPRGVVERSLLAVDPSPSERDFERCRVGERVSDAPLRDPEEDAGRPDVVRTKPGVPPLCARQRKDTIVQACFATGHYDLQRRRAPHYMGWGCRIPSGAPCGSRNTARRPMPGTVSTFFTSAPSFFALSTVASVFATLT